MNRRRAILVALLVFNLAAPAIPVEKAAPENPTDALLRAEYFSVWGVGYAGTPTANERIFHAFMGKKPSSGEATRLISEGTPAAKIYGLLALKNLSPAEFEKLAPKFFRDRTAVKTLSGCDPTPRAQSAGTLVRQISEGTIALQIRRK